MAQHNKLGKEGELFAKNYLRERGYIILETNWTSGKNELDIIAQKDDMLVVVEVKSRSTSHFEHPSDAITNAKINRIVEAANDYLSEKKINLDVRFDVITILTQGCTFKIEHFEDAFFPPLN